MPKTKQKDPARARLLDALDEMIVEHGAAAVIDSLGTMIESRSYLPKVGRLWRMAGEKLYRVANYAKDHNL